MGKAILKGRQWNFLLDVSGNTDGLDRDLQSIKGIDEIEKRAHGWFLRCTADVRAEVVSLVSQREFATYCNSAPRTPLWKKSI